MAPSIPPATGLWLESSHGRDAEEDEGEPDRRARPGDPRDRPARVDRTEAHGGPGRRQARVRHRGGHLDQAPGHALRGNRLHLHPRHLVGVVERKRHVAVAFLLEHERGRNARRPLVVAADEHLAIGLERQGGDLRVDVGIVGCIDRAVGVEAGDAVADGE